MATSAIVLATGYLLWRGFAEQLLTLRSGVWRRPGVGGIRGGMGDGAACGGRVSLPGCHAADAVWMLSPALLPLMVSVLAPWSLSRIRHT